jgi:hypothetical protein
MCRHKSSLSLGILLVAMFQAGAVGQFSANTDSSLVGFWTLDDGSGTTAVDSSPNQNNGTFYGDPEWVAGWYGGALALDGDDYVDTGYTENLATWTISVWVTSPAAPSTSGSPSGPLHRENNYQINWDHSSSGWPGSVAVNVGSWYSASLGTLQANTWYNLCGTFDGTSLKAYTNGVLITTTSASGTPSSESNTLKLGRHGASAQYYTGTVDDARVYNRALTLEEIQVVMEGGIDPGLASVPYPQDEATDVLRDMTLSWTPGEYAATHNVYLSTVLEDITAATAGNPLGVLVSQGDDANSFDPGRLELGQTYYWRVDEVNAAPDYTVFKGAVWSFTIEPFSYLLTAITATASSVNRADMGPEKTIDGSGLDGDQHSSVASDMWLSNKKGEQPTWIQFSFDGVYKLDKMLVWNSNQAMETDYGLGAKDVKIEYSADGETWTSLGDFVFAQAPGTSTYVSDIVIDFTGVAAKDVKLTISTNWGDILPQYGLSEVQFYYMPVSAREPSPADDANDVNPQVQMTWRAGREADSHKVYVGQDEQAVADGTAPVATVSSPEYETSLMLDTTYYWKVTEVNDAQTLNAWDSKVWSFTTAGFVAADDFEGYTDDLGNRIYEFWVDGYGIGDNGSLVGYDKAPFAEQTVLHTGKQSMPFAYDNTGGVTLSEAKLALDPTQDWTQHGFTTLVLYFRGLAANSPAPLYLKINDTRISYNNGATATTMPLWKQWTIPLAGTGATLKSIKSLTLGIGGTGTGTVYFDDIRLYAVAPEVVAPVDPGTTGLVALYTMDGNVEDTSGKKYNGTLSGDAGYEAGYSGQALVFNGINAYVDLPIGPMIATLSNTTIATHAYFGGGTGSWQRVFDFGTGTTVYMFLSPRQSTGGTMRFAIRTATVAEQVVDGPIMSVGWHHMAVAINSTAMTMNLYLDGELVGSAATTLLPKDLGNTTQSWIGRSQYEADAYFTGSIDDFRIYNRVLSEAEVRYLAGDR